MAFRHGDLHWRPRRRFSARRRSGVWAEEGRDSQQSRAIDSRTPHPWGFPSRERARSSQHAKPFVPVVGTTRVVSSEYGWRPGGWNRKDVHSIRHIDFGQPTSCQIHRLPARDNSAGACRVYSSLPGHSAGVFCFKGCFFPTHPKPTTRHKGDDDRWRTEKERGCSVRSRSMIIAVN